MTRKFLILIGLLCSAIRLDALPIMYAEHYYNLYHLNLYRYQEDYLENLFYLELALEAPFANPLNAIAKVETKKEHEYYRYLFKMHCNLKMAENFRYLAGRYDKRKAYWFNAPFRRINIKGLNTAEELYRTALYYWEEAKKWSAEAWKFQYMALDEVQFWMDECWRIENGELDYGKYIDKDLERVAKVRAEFEAMDETTFPIYPGHVPLNGFFQPKRVPEIKAVLEENDRERARLREELNRNLEEWNEDRDKAWEEFEANRYTGR